MRVVTSDHRTIEIGTAETTPTIGMTDYSRRETDDFGVTTVVQRGFARQMSVRVAVPFDMVDGLQRELAALRASPATWIVDDQFDSLSFEGFYKDFSLDLATPPTSYCTLTVEGLAEFTSFSDEGTDPASGSVSSSLQLLQPFDIDDDALTSISVAEDDYPEWDFAATYGLGTRVIKALTHRVYESAAAGNVGNDPAGESGLWFDVGPTNRWAMFDQALGSATEAEDEIVLTLAPGREIAAIALLDVAASTVRVQASGYDRTLPPSSSNGMAMFLDLPGSLEVTVTISGPGTVSAGTLLLGRLVGLGVTEASPTAQITDYSLKETDDFGNVTIARRAWAKRMNVRALFDTQWLDMVFGRIATVRAKPSLWIGDSSVESICVYGFFRDFSIEVQENISFLTLSVEGLSTAPKLAPIVDAGDVTYEDGSSLEDWKPADKEATAGAPPGTMVGDVLAEELVNTLTEVDFALGLTREDVAATRGQVDGILEQIPGIQNDIQDVLDSVANLGGEVETALSSVGAGNPNLLRGGGFENGWDDWIVRAGVWGIFSTEAAKAGTHAFSNNPPASAYIEHRGVPSEAGRTYTVAGRARIMGGAAGYACFDMIFRNSAGEVILPDPGDGPHYPIGTDFESTIDGKPNRYFGAFTATAPAGTATVHARCLGLEMVGVGQVAFQWVKLEIGDKPSAFSNEASVVQAFAAVATATESAAQAITEVRAGQAGNMIDNSGFAIGSEGWWTWTNMAGVDFQRNGPNDDWRITDTNALAIHQEGVSSVGDPAADWNTGCSIEPGKWYDLSVLAAAHRCQVRIFGVWRDAADNWISDVSVPFTTVGTGGRYRTGWTRLGVKAQAPANAARLWFVFRKGNTAPGEGDSWAWMCEPQVKPVAADAASPQPYQPGTGLATSTIQQGAISTLEGKTAAYLEAVAAAGGSRAAVRMVADGSNSGIELQADAIRLGNGNLPAMDVVDGKVRMYGQVTIGGLPEGTGYNLVINDFSTGSLEGWSYDPAYSNISIDTATSGLAWGPWRAFSNARDQFYSRWISVIPGETYYMGAWVHNAAAERANLFGHFRRGDGSSYEGEKWLWSVGTDVKNNWVWIEALVTVPSDVNVMRMLLQTDRSAAGGNWTHWARPRWMRAVDRPGLIVNGAITAPKISVSSLDAISANLGTIEVDTANIKNLAVGTNKIAINAVSKYYSYYGGSGNFLDTTTWLEVGSLTVTTYGTSVQITAGIKINAPLTSGQIWADVYLARGASYLAGRRGFATTTNGMPSDYLTFYLDDNPGVGTHTYKLYAKADTGTTFHPDFKCFWSDAAIRTLELVR